MKRLHSLGGQTRRIWSRKAFVTGVFWEQMVITLCPKRTMPRGSVS